METDPLVQRVRGCLAGVQIGDAMGMPWEMMSSMEIMESTGGRGVEGFSNPVQTRIKGTAGLKAGDTTDDWQLTKAWAESLIRRGGLDLFDVALAHVAAYESSTFGWGRSTRKSLKQLVQYLSSRGVEGRSPSDPVPHEPGGGRGNGVAMKVAAPAVWTAIRHRGMSHQSGRALFLPGLYEHVLGVGSMTHSDPQASLAAYGIALVLENVLLEHPEGDPEDRRRSASWFLTQLFNRLEYCSVSADMHLEVETPLKDRFSRRLQRLFDPSLLFGDVGRLIEAVGVGPDALESVAFSIAVFLRNQTDFRTAVLEAVNAGGDTDTSAAMVGAMVGARVGARGIPAEWLSFRDEFRESSDLADRMVASVTGSA